MIYNLSTENDKQRFKDKVNKLYSEQKIVELKEKKPIRSVKQNAYLHLIITWFAIENACELEWVKQKYFKELCNKEIFVTTKLDPYTGQEETHLKSSSEITTEEMTTAIQRFRNWSSQNGTYLPEPEDVEFLTHIQIESQKYKEYL